MATEETDRLPNLIKSFPKRVDRPPVNNAYAERINHYVQIFCAMNPGNVANVANAAMRMFYECIWSELYTHKETTGEFRDVRLSWWEIDGHRFVDAEYYLEHWKDNYAKLAVNWDQIASDPAKVDWISNRIRMGIAGQLYARDYENALFATLKYHQRTYPRLKKWSLLGTPGFNERDRYKWLVQEITEVASALPYSDAINFLGEMSGAYILSCPLRHAKSILGDRQRSKQNPLHSPEENCVMALLEYFWAWGSQEFAMLGSELPLKCQKNNMSEEERKYIVEVPKNLP
jgi:hypothetical protein